MRWSPVALVASVGAGCSLIYNPNNLPDPRIIDAAVVDSDPTMPALTDISPAFIDEGQGDGGSLPALLVLRGKNLVNANLKVTLTPPGGEAVHLDPVADARASSDFDYVVFTVTAHVDRGLAADVHVPLDVAVTQDVPSGASVSSQPLSGMLTLHGHGELEAAAGAMLAGPFEPMYSAVQLGDVTFSGSMPVEIRAISSITTGAIAASALNDKAGPGGHAGAATQGGGCGGGGAGTAAQVAGTGGGGGGAGFAADGSAGTSPGGLGGATGGAAGHLCGNPLMVPIESNLPSAGGVGGAGSVAGGAAGGIGGGAGGVVVLVAGGDLTTGDIGAHGGSGAKGSIGVGSGGGGGGGAGGAVIVGSDAGTLTLGKIDVAGASGGSPGGGASSAGRVRWDTGGSPPKSLDGAAHRGPAFVVTARVFRTLPQTLMLVGTRGDGFDVSVTDQDHAVHDGGHATFDASNSAMITPPLHPGFNRICITLDGGTQGHLEADKCLDVAYLP